MLYKKITRKRVSIYSLGVEDVHTQKSNPIVLKEKQSVRVYSM